MVRRFLPFNLLIQLNNWYTASLAVVLAHNQLIIIMRGAKEPEKRVQHKLYITRHWRLSLIEAVIWFWCAEGKSANSLLSLEFFLALTLNIISRTVSYRVTLIFPVHMVPSQTGILLILYTWLLWHEGVSTKACSCRQKWPSFLLWQHQDLKIPDVWTEREKKPPTSGKINFVSQQL